MNFLLLLLSKNTIEKEQFKNMIQTHITMHSENATSQIDKLTIFNINDWTNTFPME